jgi:electron transfer flavoprotein alpha subunit
MSVLVIAEHNNKTLRTSVLNTLTAARQLSDSISVLVAGFDCESVVEELKFVEGVDKILISNHRVYQHNLAETLTPLILNCLGESQYILAAATTFGKNILPRVAAALNASQVSEAVEIVDKNTYRRPVYAGNAIARVRAHDPVQVVTVRPTAFEPAKIVEKTAATCSQVNFVSDNILSLWLSENLQSAEKPELSSYSMVIAGGRGVGNKENFARLMRIAERLGAAFGASRAAVDSGMAPNDMQIGQTGQIVAPKIYIAVGISGAIQHLAGMKDSGIIVAINSDPEAPIFQVADYGLVGDIEQILPEWEALLETGLIQGKLTC